MLYQHPDSVTARRRDLQSRAFALRAVARTLMITCLIVVGAGTGWLVSTVRALFDIGRHPTEPQLLPALLWWVCALTASGLLGVLGFRLHRQGRRVAARAASAPVQSGEPIVLYLRPFGADAHLAGMDSTGTMYGVVGSYLTYEEQLQNAFRTVGPMLAISRPNEELPPTGAYRTVAAQWQQTVIELLGRAALVIVTLGRSQGIRWEIARAVERVPPHRLLLLSLVDEIWYEDVRQLVAGAFPRGLPSYPPGMRRHRMPITAAIWFRFDWTPVVVRLDSVHVNALHPLESACVYELGPVYEAIGARWPGFRSGNLRRRRMTQRGAGAYLRGCLLMAVVAFVLLIVAIALIV